MTADCESCGTDVSLPYVCRRCGASHCSAHRLPENHDCPFDARRVAPLEQSTQTRSRDADTTGLSTGWRRLDRAVTELWATVNGTLSYALLALIGLVYVAEFLVLVGVSPAAFQSVFVLHPDRPWYVWTWVSSVFAHSPASVFHILANGILLYFFGPLAERKLGSRRFGLLFVGAGVTAGLVQIGAGLLLGQPSTGVLGASGALAAIIGLLTVSNPRLTVYLYFLLPLPLGVVTAGFVGVSLAGIFIPGLLGGIAHIAHLTGLSIGLVTGYALRETITATDRVDLSL